MKIQFKVKYKVNCKWNSKCKWKWISPWPSAATTIMLRALTSNRADHVLACNMAEWRQFASKKSCEGETTSTRICRGERWNNCAEDEFRSNWKTAKVHQDWAKRICPIRIRWYNFQQHSQKYFAAQIDKDMICDILAGERGPSCKKMSQIPDHKVFYVHFIKMSDAEVWNDQDEVEHEQQMHKVCDNTKELNAGGGGHQFPRWIFFRRRHGMNIKWNDLSSLIMFVP